MSIRATEIRDILKTQIQDFDAGVTMSNVGNVIEVGDGIAVVYGLSDVRANELVEFQNGVIGMAFNLQEDSVGIIILGDYLDIEEGDEVRTTGRIAEVPVGEALQGRVVDTLGNPIDDKGPIETDKTRPLERIAPGVIERQDVDTALQTGLIAIDALTAIGRGQRQLIIGDRQTGKTALAIDAIINQRDTGVVCIYVAVGQKRAQVAQLVGILEQYGAMDHTIVVAATASDPAPMQYLAPYAGCAIGEEVMENGGDALIVYDDLSKHAWAYRQVSLLMRRPPGREAYPGDVFYLHSRLLERAARLSEDRGGGSLTALPIIETQANDVSAYIPTNVISITDGQIFLETELFYAGVRPAINAGLSVSRVGGDAQIRAMRQVAGQLRLDLAQYRSLEAFAQFGTEDLDPSTRRQLERGAKMTEMLKQGQYHPLAVEDQVVALWTGSHGYLDDIPVSEVQRFRNEFIQFMESSHRDFLDKILEQGRFNDDDDERMEKLVADFKSTFAVEA